jgi:hypothetical protein
MCQLRYILIMKSPRRKGSELRGTSPFATIVDELRAGGTELAPGLTYWEIKAIEDRYRFNFSPDLREFLQIAVPISPDSPTRGFPNWRVDSTQLRDQLSWLLEGLLFDVEHNAFWRKDWGERPADLEAAKNIAREAVAAAPVLIPIYSHRYLPAEPLLSGNPVLSVYQTDIVYYGWDLASYFNHEFRTTLPPGSDPMVYGSENTHEPRPIPFWDRVAGFTH